MTLTLSLLLLLAPPEPTLAEGDYAAAVAELDVALGLVGGEGVSQTDAAKALESALTRVERFPGEVPGDASKLGKARLALAWVYLVDGREAEASAAMDEALRSARGTPLHSGAFGAKIRALHDERLRALEEQGTAEIAVECGNVECQLVIDEQGSANRSDPLYLGTYRVWIGSVEGRDWEFHSIVLDQVGESVVVEYEVGRAALPEPDLGDEPGHEEPIRVVDEPGKATLTGPEMGDEPGHERSIRIVDEPSKAKRERIMPLAAEVVGLTAGVGLVVAGAIVAMFDSKCELGGSKDIDGFCKTYSFHPAVPGALFGLGGAAMLAFGVTLTVDRVRIRNANSKQAMLTWTLRF